MVGKNHIITGAASVVLIDTGVKIFSGLTESDYYSELHNSAFFENIIKSESVVAVFFGSVLTAMICTGLFFLGCLLPDVDQENSTLGKVFYIPVRHRTWTHSIWGLFILAAISYFVPCIAWLALGCTLHIFWDSLSKGGICWFYPISKYKNWTSGAQIKKNHWIFLYRAGETSEKIITILTVIISVAALIYNILLTVKVLDLPTL